MDFLWGLLTGLLVGGTMGALIMAAFCAAKDADRSIRGDDPHVRRRGF